MWAEESEVHVSGEQRHQRHRQEHVQVTSSGHHFRAEPVPPVHGDTGEQEGYESHCCENGEQLLPGVESCPLLARIHGDLAIPEDLPGLCEPLEVPAPPEAEVPLDGSHLRPAQGANQRRRNGCGGGSSEVQRPHPEPLPKELAERGHVHDGAGDDEHGHAGRD